MPIRGAGGVAERNIPLAGTGITIRIDDGQPADAAALQHALASAPAQTWTGVEVTVTGELDFWLAGQDGFFRLLAGTDAAQRAGLVPPAFSWGAMGLLTRDSFACLTRRPGRPGHSELSACGSRPGARARAADGGVAGAVADVAGVAARLDQSRVRRACARLPRSRTWAASRWRNCPPA